MRRDKTLDTVLKTALPVPGAYIEDVLTIHVAPCLHSPAVPKLSLPEPAVSTMPCAEICESPIQDDNCTSFVKGSPEDPQSYDAAGYMSDQSSDTDTGSDADIDCEDKGEDGFEYRRSTTYDNQRFEMGYRAPLVPSKRLPNLPPVPTDKLSRKLPPLKRALSRVFSENGVDGKSSPTVTSLFSKAHHDLAHLFTQNDPHHLVDSPGASISSYGGSSPEVSPSPSPTIPSHIPGVVTVTDVFEHPTHTVTRTVIRPSPSHFPFSLRFKRSSSSLGSKSGSKSFFRTQESSPIPDVRSMFEEELDASLQRWEDEREGCNPLDVYIVVDRETAHEESWRSLVQEVHYNRRPPTRKVSSECGRW